MPRGELRRKDRGMDALAAEQCMARALVGHVGTAGPGSMPYVVPMNFTATEATGRVSGKIRVETDVPGAGAVEVNVDGQVVP